MPSHAVDLCRVRSLLVKNSQAAVYARPHSRLGLSRHRIAEKAKPTIDGEKVDARLQPRLPDRRFRRIYHYPTTRGLVTIFYR
jgi:hypothetical protein